MFNFFSSIPHPAIFYDSNIILNSLYNTPVQDPTLNFFFEFFKEMIYKISIEKETEGNSIKLSHQSRTNKLLT